MALITLTKDNFTQTIEQNEIVFIDFWADWCGPCKAFHPTFLAASDKYPEITFAQINIDEEKEIAQTFQIRSIPLLMVFKQQVIIFSESGLLPPSGLDDLVHQAKELDMTEVLAKISEQEKNK